MSSFDVGGSRAGTQTGYSAYGRGDQVRVQVDGANATEDTGGTGYFNYGAFEEVQIGTDSNDASMPTPGVQINAVVKSGGNQFRGDLYLDFQHESMQGSNVTDEIRRKGLGEGTRITKYYDPEPRHRRADQARQGLVLRLGCATSAAAPTSAGSRSKTRARSSS